MLNEENELHNRVMHISGKFVFPPKANDESIKADIEMQKANDESIKANIRKPLEKMIPGLSVKQWTISYAYMEHTEQKTCLEEKI